MDFEKDPASLPELQRWCSAHETSASVAEGVAACFEEMTSALSPIIGSRGVVALISRSVHVASARHPWLRAGGEPALQSVDVAAFRQAILQREVQEAASGASDLLDTFRTLLSSLIGASLTGKLLGPAWARFSNDVAVKKAPS